MITEKFAYQTLTKQTQNSHRVYETPSGKLPSVTTILSATKSPESQQALANWRARVGEKQAQAITTEAANRGTRMHKWLENYVCNDDPGVPGSNPYSQQSFQMASKIIENYLKPRVTAYYGSEVTLYYPDLYAGTTDLVAEWEGELAIIDFKQTNTPKKTEWISDYFTQLAAYKMAHDFHYNTNITTGVILMCSKDFAVQSWVITAQEFTTWQNVWADKLTQYYKIT